MINYISSVKIVSVKTYIELLLYEVITFFNQIKLNNAVFTEKGKVLFRKRKAKL